MKKITSLFSIFMFSAAPVLAVEDCTIARTANFTNEPVYQINRAHSGHTFQLKNEVNALIFRRGNSVPVYNELAKNVTYLNNGQTMRVEMRENCGWSDGFIITAEEVVEGIKQTFTQGPESSNVGRAFIKNGKDIIEGNAHINELGVRVIDNFTFEIDITANGQLMEKILTRLNFTPYPLHLSADEQDKWNEGYIQRVSSGPYYASKINDKELVLDKNPYFCEDLLPEIEKVIYYNNGNSVAQTGLFFSKQINIAERFNNRTLKTFEARSELAPFKKRETSSEVVTFLLQSSHSQLMDEPKLREVIFLATDLEQFSKTLDLDKNFLNQPGALSYPYPEYEVPQDPLFQLDYSERLLKANEIMASFGYNLDNPLKLKIVALNRAGFDQVETSLKSMWSQVGIHAEFEYVALKDFSWKGLEEWPGGYDYFLVGMESDFPDPSDFLSWLNIHSADERKEDLEKRILDTFKIYDNNIRLEKLRELEVEMRESRTALSLYAATTPWIIDETLEFGDYFHLLGMNLKSTTCPSES